MVRDDIVEKVAQVISLNKSDADKVVDAFFNGMIDAVKNGDRIELRGLGTFGMKERAERKARNLKTGEEIKLASRKVPFFRVGKDLKIL
jgi:DNA-binding protein HU-beta